MGYNDSHWREVSDRYDWRDNGVKTSRGAKWRDDGQSDRSWDNEGDSKRRRTDYHDVRSYIPTLLAVR
jgi:hypothetical protein